jgi:putative transposase
MIKFNPIIHHRKSIRIHHFDYSQAGLYFITICNQDKIPLFGKINNKEMHLSEIGAVAHDEWLNLSHIRDNIILHEFIVMLDHFHAIIEIKFSKGNNQEAIDQFKSPSQTIGSIIRGYKIATTKQIK